MPNPDYVEICNACKSKNIVLIDDLAQTVGAAIHGVEVGCAGDFAVYSFGSDKPLSCYRGGLLTINDDTHLEYLNHQHRLLAGETPQDELDDLFRLLAYYFFFDPDYYKLGASFGLYIDKYLIRLLNKYKILFVQFLPLAKWVPGHLISVLDSIYYKCFIRNFKINIYRLGPRKIQYLTRLWQSYDVVKEQRCRTAQKAQQVLQDEFPVN